MQIKSWNMREKSSLTIIIFFFFWLGHFLWFTGPGKTQIWSTTIPPTGLHCVLELSLYQVEMRNGDIQLLIIKNNTSWVATGKPGNNYAEYVIA